MSLRPRKQDDDDETCTQQQSGRTGVVLVDPSLLRPVVPTVPVPFPNARGGWERGPGGINPANDDQWRDRPWQKALHIHDDVQGFDFDGGVYSGNVVGGVPNGFGTFSDTLSIVGPMTPLQLAFAAVTAIVKALADKLESKNAASNRKNMAILNVEKRYTQKEISHGARTREKEAIRAKHDREVETIDKEIATTTNELREARKHREDVKPPPDFSVEDLWESFQGSVSKRRGGKSDQNAFTTWLLKRRELWPSFNGPTDAEYFTYNQFREQYIMPAFQAMDIEGANLRRNKGVVLGDGLISRSEFFSFFYRMTDGEIPPNGSSEARREYDGDWIEGETIGNGRLIVSSDSIGITEMSGVFSSGYNPVMVDLHVDNTASGYKLSVKGVHSHDGRFVAYDGASGRIDGKLDWKLNKGEVRFSADTDFSDGAFGARGEVFGKVTATNRETGDTIVGEMQGSRFIGPITITSADGIVTRKTISGYSEDGLAILSDDGAKPKGPTRARGRSPPSSSPKASSSPKPKKPDTPPSPPATEPSPEPPSAPANDEQGPGYDQNDTEADAILYVIAPVVAMGVLGYVVLKANELATYWRWRGQKKIDDNQRRERQRLRNEAEATRMLQQEIDDNQRRERQRLRNEAEELLRLQEGENLRWQREMEEEARMKREEDERRLKQQGPKPTDRTIRAAVKYVLEKGGPNYVHPTYGPIADWDVSEVTDMSKMFNGAKSFNGDVSKWTFPNVTNMKAMFHGATSFNGDLKDWKFPNVTDMSEMFHLAPSFNGDLKDWKFPKVTAMSWMFSGATSFNGDVSEWTFPNVTDMTHMFALARSFNGDVSKWTFPKVTTMWYIFIGATSFKGKFSSEAIADLERRGVGVPTEAV